MASTASSTQSLSKSRDSNPRIRTKSFNILSLLYMLQGLIHLVTDKCGNACVCISRENKGSSLGSCPVKMLEIHGLEGTLREVELITHFLTSFPCLKEAFICPKIEDCELLQIVMKLLTLQGIVSNCKVRFG